MDPSKAILHELYVYCEWNPEPEYIQKSDSLLPEKIPSVKQWFKHVGPKKTLFDSITAHKEHQQKWQIALGDEGKVIAVLTDIILEIRTKRSDYATIAARTTVTRDPYPQWRKMEWSPDCAFLVLAYGIGHVDFYDLSASKLFTIDYECSRPGGLECTDMAHAIASIIFLPTAAKSTEIKWNWEVLLVGYDGSLRAYLISLTEGYSFKHRAQFKGGLGATAYCLQHNTMYVGKLPYPSTTDPEAAYSFGLTAWRLTNEYPHYKLSVVSDNVVAQVNNNFNKFLIPFTFGSTKKLAVIIEMQISPDTTKLVCVHSNGDITIWRLPLLKLLHKFPLACQPGHDLRNPLVEEKTLKKDLLVFHPADVNWWSNEEIILSRFSGAVSICGIADLMNLLSNNVEFLQGAPRVTCAYDNAFLALECEAKVLPARRSPTDESEFDCGIEKFVCGIEEFVCGIEEFVCGIEDFVCGIEDFVCSIEDLVNLLSNNVKFLQGAPRVTCAYDNTFLALECEAKVLPARRSPTDESVEVVKEEEEEENVFGRVKEMVKTVVYAITDIEKFQPKPRRITCVSRVYRLLAVKSTTPTELFSRKIESGQYSEALKLADTFSLDSDLVYQQQWRKNPVSTDAIHNYLSKVSKKIWAVHQCVDRLPETLPAAKELLQFGLELTSRHILEEVNRDRERDPVSSHDAIQVEHLNAYTSELLRCRHVMLFYKERLFLYELILKREKSTYAKDEYHRLRSNSILHSSIEIAKEGRILALHCLWSHIATIPMKLAILEKLPETIPPFAYQHLLPTTKPIDKELIGSECSLDIEVAPMHYEEDWCRKPIFRSIWSSNWSEESSPDTEATSELSSTGDLATWYAKRAREIEERSSIITNALSLITLACHGGAVPGLDKIFFDLTTLDTLVYDINKEGITLKQIEEISVAETCKVLMSMSSAETYIEDMHRILTPFLKRYEKYSGDEGCGHTYVCEYLEMISRDDLCPILMLMQNNEEYSLDYNTRVMMTYKCLEAHTATDQLDVASELLEAIAPLEGYGLDKETKRRLREMHQRVGASKQLASRGILVPPRDLSAERVDQTKALSLLTRLARDLAKSETKPSQADWEKLLKDIMELQSTCFFCVSENQCYEIYASALLTSGDLAAIKLAGTVLSCDANGRASRANAVPYAQTVNLVLQAAKEYFNSASALNDPALELAKCCLSLIKDINPVIQEELDLIAALYIINSFNLNILPIQVRLCENKMQLIEDCLKADPGAYQASHKLLKLAALLRVEGDDEIGREGEVLMKLCQHLGSMQNWSSSVDAARRLAALHIAPAAEVIAQVASYSHAERDTRRYLFAAAAAHCPPEYIETMLDSRLSLELEGLKEMGLTMKETSHLSERCPSTDDEFADAITTPVVEKKDLVPSKSEKKIPLFNYLLDSFQNKFSVNQSKTQPEQIERTVHVQEFYNSIYPDLAVSDNYYRYDRFSVPDVLDGRTPVGHSVLQWFYIQNCLMQYDGSNDIEMETEVIQKCAEELIYSDTSVGVACLLRGAEDKCEATKRFVSGAHSDIAVSCALYAAAVRSNSAQLKDNVYLTQPKQLAENALKNENIREEQMELIRQCIDRLSGMADVDALRALGLNVNGLLFNADPDYRREMILRVARLPGKENLELACSLCDKYGCDVLEAWLQHARAAPHQPHLTRDSLPNASGNCAEAHRRITETVYPAIDGSDHAALIQIFTVLKDLDEKALISGLSAAEHIKLLKKCKAASPELDYKMVTEQRSADEVTDHLLQIIRTENIGMIGKFLRTLPPALKLPISVNALYTQWLTKYFFSVPKSAESSKKWMQQYRQCASYFNKLSKEELMRFVRETCFSERAVDRVPHNTRNLMIMQAVDYCTQEQENEIKSNKNEQSWSQVGQELARWARFLENYHSPSVANIVDNTDVPREERVWRDIEMSHGDSDKLTEAASALVERGVSSGALTSLLQCLNADVQPHRLFRHLARTLHRDKCEILVTRLVKYHSEGVKFPEEVIELVLQKAVELGLPAHRQICLMALRGGARTHSDDLPAVAHFSLQLFRAEWPDLPYAAQLTEETLLTEEGRRSAFAVFLSGARSLRQRKALTDALACWPPTRHRGARSLHCEYLHTLLQNTSAGAVTGVGGVGAGGVGAGGVGAGEARVYIQLLIKRPLLNDQEIQYLMQDLPADSVFGMIWILLLNKCPNAKDYILKLADRFEDELKSRPLEPELTRALLDAQLLVPLVSTALYPHIAEHIYQHDEEPYSVRWAVGALRAANCLSEAGHLYLMTAAVPTHLRGFSEAVRFCDNVRLFYSE